MSVSEALRAARAAGIEIRLVRDDLVLRADSPAPTAVLELLSVNKAAIVAILRPDGEDWVTEDWWDFYIEQVRAAERDRGLAECIAEDVAYVRCLAEWMSRNDSDPAVVEYVQRFVANDPLQKNVAPGWDSAELPAQSWDGRCEYELLRAAEALEAMGILFRPRFPNDFEKSGGV